MVSQVENDPFITSFFLRNAQNHVTMTEIGLDVDLSTYVTNITPNYTETGNFIYPYQVSLLAGDLNVVIDPGITVDGIEVGSSGTATVVGGTASTLYLWHQKSLVWEDGFGNSVVFGPYIVSQTTASGDLVLNLLTGQGTNPYGGNLQVSGVDNVTGGDDAGEYIVANNDGDRIQAGNAPFVTLIGGGGADALYGDNGTDGDTLLVAGGGTATLAGGGYLDTALNTFVYSGGVDTITNFRAGTGSGDTLDLSNALGVSDFSGVMADATQSDANTVLNFGDGHTITLDNVTTTSLVASNFVFQPIVAWVQPSSGVALNGATVTLTLTISDAVTVTGGSPLLTLSDGATASYDAAASDPAGHLLVFDYTVGAGDHSPNRGCRRPRGRFRDGRDPADRSPDRRLATDRYIGNDIADRRGRRRHRADPADHERGCDLQRQRRTARTGAERRRGHELRRRGIRKHAGLRRYQSWR
jgi:hypothetical protein